MSSHNAATACCDTTQLLSTRCFAVEETLDQLQEKFTRQLYARQCEAVYQHVFANYWDDGRSVGNDEAARARASEQLPTSCCYCPTTELRRTGWILGDGKYCARHLEIMYPEWAERIRQAHTEMQRPRGCI